MSESRDSGGGEPGPFAFLSRRRFLALGLGGGALVCGAVAGGLGWLRGTDPEVAGLGVLGAQEYRTLLCLARTFLPAGGAFPPGAEDLQLARRFDAFLAGEPEANRDDLTMALRLLEFGPVIWDHRLVTFSHLGASDQLAHWESWATADALIRRKVRVAFRRFFSMVFFGDPRVWPFIGYPGLRIEEGA